ncbi:hypothetical protein [Abyssicoccus albus]|nr:hypothetical protein [Abyssicoccus albus]
MVEILEQYLGRDWNVVMLIMIFAAMSITICILETFYGGNTND